MAAVLFSLLAGCGGSSSTGTTGTTGTTDTVSPAGSAATASGVSGHLTVLAAASLTETFTALGKSFEAAHPGTTITFSFGASSTLATQITQGAPADVFASASVSTMDKVVASRHASAPVTFARNEMEIAVPPANPGKITQLSDLARPQEKVALCAPAVHCGSTARTVLANAHLTLTPATNEIDVKATLAKVRLGEVDAGIVYVTDVRSAGSAVKGVPIPSTVNASTKYPIAVLTTSGNPTLAQAFQAWVLSPTGTAALTAAGFLTP